VKTRESAEFVDNEAENAPVVRKDVRVLDSKLGQGSGEPGVPLVNAVDRFVVASLVEFSVGSQNAVDGHLNNRLFEVRA